MLEKPITEEEINKALQESASGRSPGSDGFTTFYLKYKEILVPKLCHYMNGLGTEFGMSGEALAASITVVLKEGKDGTLCSSYQPISLLNANTKLYAKVLATRMKDLMNSLVHPDQVGFIPGREGRGNGLRTLLLLQKIKKGGSPVLVLSMDAEKAFIRVDWGFMIETLESMGVGPRMIQLIKVLYKQPTASVNINRMPSPSFKMRNGTRQGCLLSPLLFVLSLEPLLATI